MFFNRRRAGFPAAFLSLVLVSCGGAPEHEARSDARAPVLVSTISAAVVEWPSTYEATGTVRARIATTLSSRVMGYVREVRVQAGDTVREGQALVMLDARDLETSHRQAQSALEEARSAQPEIEGAIAAARAQLDLAQATLNRMQDLLAKRSVSQQEFDEAAARAKVARSGVDMAAARKLQLAEKIRQAEHGLQQAAIAAGYSEVKAPWAGRVTARRAEPGVLASPGMPLLDLEQQGSYRLEVSVAESNLQMVKRGERVTVRLEAVDQSFPGIVGEITPAVDASSRAFTVKIDLPSQAALRDGLFGRADFSTGKREVLAIPHSAVSAQGQIQSVWVADAGVARSRMVTLGASQGESVEVLTGLESGEKLIHPRPSSLSDGTRVEVRP